MTTPISTDNMWIGTAMFRNMAAAHAYYQTEIDESRVDKGSESELDGIHEEYIRLVLKVALCLVVTELTGQ